MGPKSRAASASSEPTLQQIMEKLDDNRHFMEREFHRFGQLINDITARVDHMEKQQLDYEAALTFCGDEIKDLKQQLEFVKTKEKEDGKLKEEVSKMQDEKFLKTLRITGIPQTKNEDLSAVVTKLAAEMECKDLTNQSIDSCFRVKPKSEQSAVTTIIIKFTAMDKRDSFYDGRKALGKKNITTASLGMSCTNKIYINESLNRSTQSLFYQARKRRSELDYKYIWTFHGQIFLRKNKSDDAIKINSQTDLTNLN